MSGFDHSGVTSTLIALLTLTFIVDMLIALARRAIRQGARSGCVPHAAR